MSEESNNTVIRDTNITTTSTMSTTETEKETAALGTGVSTKTADINTNVETVDIEDLEDGEIDEDDEEDDDVVVTGAITGTIQANTSAKSTTKSTNDASSTSKTINDVTAKIPIIDLSHDHTPSPTSASNSKPSESKSRRSKKSQPPKDDYMEEVEKSLSIILMKAGKEPQLPKCLETRQQQELKESDSTVSLSRSSRRRKRRKQREEREKEKDKERKDKEKPRFHSPEAYNGAPPLEDDEDDFEMLNVVGGSPSSTPVPKYAPSAYPIYDSAEESYTSYDSCDSLDGERGGGGESKRRRRRNKKERKRGRDRDRDRRARSREDSARGGGPSEKRSRRDSNDDKHRQEPRKLELCKFYLMECCAKKDKCSYMHSDFPCKYYYLGMECPNIETCKFMHEAPLSEQLRNILLKHLETAPKEILGNFKRISRENAIAMMTKRNEELCKEYKVENTWAPIVNIATNNNRRGGNQGGGGAGGNMLNEQHQQQQQQQQQQQKQHNQQQHQQSHSNIPSLFDIVVKPPVSLLSVGDKHRKSRWADSPTREEPTTTTQENNTSSLPSYLDLKNLEGIMKAEHIQKLTTLGITNFQEINQFTFGQLQKIGIDFVEISEVQKKVQSRMENKAETEEEPKIPTTRDVDMRSIPSATTTAYSEPVPMTTTTSTSSLSHNPTMDGDSNSNNSTGVVRFEYSQYLKDSNLAFDRCDAYDDERDEEQLVIDDPNMEHEEIPRTTTTTSNENDNVNDEPPKTSDLASRLGLHLNPFNPFRTNPGDFLKNENKSNTNNASSSGFQYNDHKRTRGRSRSRSRSRSHSRSRSRSRSRSHTPIRTQSTTPEASDSADNDDVGGTTKAKQPIYERKTMYDFDAVQAKEDERQLSERSDKDMRYVPGSNSMLPFQAVTNYTPATEIDAAMSSHLPMAYKVHEFDMPPANYADLRRNLRATTNTADPRVRRILGLPETRATSVALKRAGRKLSNTIASPEADDTPKYYTPPALSSTQSTPNASERERRTEERRIEERRSSISKTASPTVSSSRTDPRLDPRCAASSAATAAAAKANEADKSSSATASASGTAGDSINARITDLGKKMRENMQNSDWYRKLNSNMKIQYNQELARLITELRRFHQDTSPDKNFNFINCNKKIIDDILIQLGIFIDENGEVNKIELDKPDESELNMNAEARGDYMQQLDFPNPQLNMPNAGYRNPIDFRFPPPALGGGLAGPRLPPIAVAAAAAAAGGMPPGGLAGVFNNNNNNMPQSLLGIPPLFHQFNAGGGNFAPNGPPQMAFGFLNFPQQMGGGGGGGPRNFNMDGGQHNRRNPNNRRHFI